MAEQFTHVGLTETHHLPLALAFGVEIRATFAAAHRQGSEGILESLLERQKFKDGKIYRRMKTGAALVRSDGRAVLNAIPTVDIHLPFIVHPGHSEYDYSLRFYQAIQNAVLRVAGVFGDKRPEAFHDFSRSL